MAVIAMSDLLTHDTQSFWEPQDVLITLLERPGASYFHSGESNTRSGEFTCTSFGPRCDTARDLCSADALATLLPSQSLQTDKLSRLVVEAVSELLRGCVRLSRVDTDLPRAGRVHLRRLLSYVGV